MYLKPTSRLSTTCALKWRAMRVTWPVVTSVLTTIGDGGSRPCCDSLFSLKWVSRAAISLPVTKRQPPGAVGDHRAEAVGVRIGGQHQVGLVPGGQRGGPVHRLGHFRVGRLGDVGELAVRRHLLRDGDDAEALADERLHRRHGADAVQRREDDLEVVVSRRRHQALLAAQVDVGVVRRLVEEVDAAGAHRLGPGQRLDRASPDRRGRP